MLTVGDHSRDSAGLTYVYPVLSRRAGGLSIGINLNPNNACNWRCVYCQVPDLKRGAAPTINLDQLHSELCLMLDDALTGDFYQRMSVPVEQQRICDLAISGNGEPTSAKEFAQVIELIGAIRTEYQLPQTTKTVLISNGSLIHQSAVQAGLKLLAQLGGELWFKLDSGSNEGLRSINNATTSIEQVQKNLQQALAICPVWIQTCLFSRAEQGLNQPQWLAYCRFIETLYSMPNQQKPQGILLYGLARPSMQAEAQQLSTLSQEQINQCAAQLRSIGVEVRVSL